MSRIAGIIFFSIFLQLFVLSICKVIELDMIKSRKMNKIYSSKSQRMLAEKDISIVYEDQEDYFTVALGLGTPPQYFAVQVDTALGITWVPSKDCVNCNSTYKFNQTASSTIQTSDKKIEIDDQDGDVKGYITNDTVRLNDLSTSDFSFIQIVKYDDDFEDYEDGKLGLGYSNKRGDNFSFMQVLKNAGVIQENIFSLSEVNTTHGKLSIGGFPEGRNEKEPSYSKCNLTSTDDLDDNFRDGWVCKISHIILEPSNNFSHAYEVSEKIIFDSASSYISIPLIHLYQFRNNYINKYFSNCKEIETKNSIGFVCPRNQTNQAHGISFVLDGYSYRISAEHLFEQLPSDNQYSELLIKFIKDDDGIWVLGHPFMSLYTIVFNGEDHNIGFYGDYTSNVITEWNDWVNGNTPAQKANRFFYMIVGATIVGSLLFMFIVFMIYHSYKRRRLEEHGPLIHSESSAQ